MRIECLWADLAERALERGYYYDEVMACICEKKANGNIVVDTDHPAYPKKKRIGPGTVLKAMLRRLGFKYEAGCQCADHAKQMNRWGPDGCEKNFDIISGWLAAEAEKRGIPYLTSLGKVLISASIKRSRRS